MLHFFVSVLILLETFKAVSGAKILMKSLQFGSHIFEHVLFGEELVSRGHEVYIAIGSRYQDKDNLEGRGIKTLPYKIPDGVFYGVSEEYEKMVAEFIFDK